MFRRAVVTNRDIHKAVSDLTRIVDRHITSTDLRLTLLEQTATLKTTKAWQIRLAMLSASFALPASIVAMPTKQQKGPGVSRSLRLRGRRLTGLEWGLLGGAGASIAHLPPA